MKKSQRIQSVKILAISTEREAANLMGQARQELTIREARLLELVNYQIEYYEKSRIQNTSTVNSRQLQVFDSFLAKLKVAIGEQKKLIEIAKNTLDEKRRQWLVTKQRLQVYDNVIQRYREDEQEQENKSQQKYDDEIAARLSQKKTNFS